MGVTHLRHCVDDVDRAAEQDAKERSGDERDGRHDGVGRG